MKIKVNDAIAILERTPAVLDSLLGGLPDRWAMDRTEGQDTFSPYDVVGHLIHGEQTDWIPRMEIILHGDPPKEFEPFDRFAQFEVSVGKSLAQLLEEFRSLREGNLARLKSVNSLEDHFTDTGIHPEFGEVTLDQLLSTWVVHDLNHIGQIVRVMARHYKDEVGPWMKYLKILRG